MGFALRQQYLPVDTLAFSAGACRNFRLESGYRRGGHQGFKTASNK